MIYFFLRIIFSTEEICLPGSVMCSNNIIQTCDLSGTWLNIQCPEKTACKLDKKKIRVYCEPIKIEKRKKKTNRKSKNTHIEKSDSSDESSSFDYHSMIDKKRNIEEQSSDKKHPKRIIRRVLKRIKGSDRIANDQGIQIREKLQVDDKHKNQFQQMSPPQQPKQGGQQPGQPQQGGQQPGQPQQGGQQPQQGGQQPGQPQQGGQQPSQPQQGGQRPSQPQQGEQRPSQPQQGGQQPGQPQQGSQQPQQGGQQPQQGGQQLGQPQQGSQQPQQGGQQPQPSQPQQGSQQPSQPQQGGQQPSQPQQGGQQPSQPQQGGQQQTSNESSQKPKPENQPKQENKPDQQKKEETPNQKSEGGNKKDDQGKSGGGKKSGKIDGSKIMEAAKAAGFQPNKQNADAVANNLGEIKEDQQVMFLAQIFHESGGLQYVEEIKCKNGGCKNEYKDKVGLPGKDYHGRGFIQLTWGANYDKASKELNMGKKLLENPESVSKDPNLAMKVSVWFWNKNVANAPGVKERKFGATTKAINGKLECTGGNVDKSKKRFEIYKKIAKILGETDLASESGCY